MKSSDPSARIQKVIQPHEYNSLTEINLVDLVASFGWEDHPRLARILRRVFIGPARSFAKVMLEFDHQVGASGLAEAARQMLGKYFKHVRVFSDDLPTGPLLALSNHPGMADTLALFSALNRTDLKIIAVDRPFLKSLPNISNRLFYVTDDLASRTSLVREVSGHLRSGGAVLTFPAGEIEPDPNVHSGAIEALSGWTDSVGIFARLAPETAILPILVRGVIWDKTARLRILRLKKTREAREKLAAALQLLAHLSSRTRFLDITVQVGKPITVRDLGSKDKQIVHQAVMAEMARLIENPPEGQGISLL